MEDTTVQSARYVRAIITCKSGQFLAQVNNRVVLGSLTIMVPGCQVAPGESEPMNDPQAIRARWEHEIDAIIEKQQQVIEKLKRLTDAEFAGLEFPMN